MVKTDSRIIAIDFDGVIDSYKGWQGEHTFHEPISGAREALWELAARGFTIVVYTCRPDISEIKKYLIKNNIPFHSINSSHRNKELGLCREKLAADIYIDDKAVCFEGRWDKAFLDKVVNFKEWWRK